MTYHLTTLSHTELNPQDWDRFIHASSQGSLYALHGYISLLRKEWLAYVVTDQQGEWCAVMPFSLNKRWRFLSLPQPLYSQYWGIYFRPFSESPRKVLTLQKEWIQLIVEQWEPIHLIVQNFSPAFTYPMPFHWAGCSIHTRYTYHLDLQPSVEELEKQMSGNHRRSIRQALKQGYHIHQQGSPETLANLMAINRQQGHDIVGPGDANYEGLKTICAYLLTKNKGYLLEVKDQEGNVVSAGIFAIYQEKFLFLAGCQHPDHKHSGAQTLLLWEAIRHAHKVGAKIFDFEGSMIEGVEHFFRKFGAIPVPYLQIRRNRLPLPVRWIHKFT